nr:pyrroloquinoline quinone biosynthesis peptide chaperone PqqD [Motiliproteus sediminis]
MALPAAVPALNRHFRFQWEPAQDCYVLLYPEGMVKLNGPAGEILACVDGERDVAAIIACLKARFPEADGIEQDIREFLGDAHEQRWIDYA